MGFAEQQTRSMQDQAAGQAQGAPQAAQPVEVENDDRSFLICLASALCYILPLSEGLQFAVPLLQAFPDVAILLAPFALLTALVDAIPFGSFILFVIFITVAQMKQFPRLLRFNMEQAVLINIALILPNLISLLGAGSGQLGLVGAVGITTFLFVAAVVIYCVATTLSGEYADGLPIVSQTTKNVIDQGTFFRRDDDNNGPLNR